MFNTNDFFETIVWFRYACPRVGQFEIGLNYQQLYPVISNVNMYKKELLKNLRVLLHVILCLSLFVHTSLYTQEVYLSNVL